MSVDLIAGGLILAFAAIVVLGHVLVVAAIYRILREDHIRGAGMADSGTVTADHGTRRIDGAADRAEREPQAGRVFGRAGWTEKTAANCRLPAETS